MSSLFLEVHEEGPLEEDQCQDDGKEWGALEVVQSRDFTLLKGLTILQIEDNLVNQFVSIEVFKSLGIVYEVVSDSTEGLELLRTKKFDLVVMD